jgi:hypothetical protein
MGPNELTSKSQATLKDRRPRGNWRASHRYGGPSFMGAMAHSWVSKPVTGGKVAYFALDIRTMAGASDD